MSRPDWRELCREQRIDPDEVRLVFDRYEAYRRYNEDRGSGASPIEQWFRFYRMEKVTESEGTGPAPGGCSVDSDAVNNACIERPGPFLAVLKAFGEAGPGR